MIYCFDIDGTLCSQEEDYSDAVPNWFMIERLNRLKRSGHEIIIWTARGSGTGKNWSALTEFQLDRWGVLYDSLHFGKPAADVYVDDRAVNPSVWI